MRLIVTAFALMAIAAPAAALTTQEKKSICERHKSILPLRPQPGAPAPEPYQPAFNDMCVKNDAALSDEATQSNQQNIQSDLDALKQ